MKRKLFVYSTILPKLFHRCDEHSIHLRDVFYIESRRAYKIVASVYDACINASPGALCVRKRLFTANLIIFTIFLSIIQIIGHLKCVNRPSRDGHAKNDQKKMSKKCSKLLCYCFALLCNFPHTY